MAGERFMAGFRLSGLALSFALGAASVPATALAIDWSGVPAVTVKTLYPGQASWEWALSKDEHSAAPRFREGKNCKACHTKEEEQIGKALAAGIRLDKKPAPGKRGSVPIDVRFAHDGQRLYVRLEFPDVAPSGNPKMDKEYPTKVTMMMDNGKVVEFTRAGCWSICHDDVNGMPSATGEMHKYLARSRVKMTRKGGGDAIKSQADLDTLFADGQFIEYWQARLKPGAPAVANDGRALEKRKDNPAPKVGAEAKLENGRWEVVLSRPLKIGLPGYKDIESGRAYTVGFAVHEDSAAGRYHQVSLEYTLMLDAGDADFIARKR